MFRKIQNLSFVTLALAAFSPSLAQSVTPQIGGGISQGFDGGISSSAVGNPTPGSAAAAALALLPDVLSQAEKNKYVSAINALDAGGWWSKMDFFYILQTSTSNNAKVDLTGHGFTAVPGGSVTFAADVGYTGNGTNAAGTIAVPYAPNPNGTNFTVNSCAMGIGIVNNRTTFNNAAFVGGQNAGNDFDQVGTLAGGTAFGDLGTTSSVSGAATTTKGTWIASRTSSSALALYQNGTTIASSGASTAVAVSTTPLTLLGRSILPSGIDSFSAETVAFAFAMSGVSSGDAASISTILGHQFLGL